MNFFTELREGLAISFSALRANKMRSTLATLGIIIGVVTVTLMGTAIEGLNRAFLNSISIIGADITQVRPRNEICLDLLFELGIRRECCNRVKGRRTGTT